jgi:hypothetical protein
MDGRTDRQCGTRAADLLRQIDMQAVRTRAADLIRRTDRQAVRHLGGRPGRTGGGVICDPGAVRGLGFRDFESTVSTFLKPVEL